MKKLNLLIGILIFGFTVLSCSSDDDNKTEETSKQELLVGKWKKVRIGVVCSSGSETSEEYSACKQNGSITFNADGTYVDIPYVQYNNDCIIDGQTNGTWEFVDNELYIKEIEATSLTKVTLFEVSKNTLKLGGDSDPCDGEDSPSIEYLGYTRIE
ncbi:lipocalin-like domain-containing protein [Cellulophaga lytica]|uniref:lipocalin family protein n=1 Tax=Cellulophaga lytica TaxID=979 RepID=UPI000B5C3A52|nr:lipocalin family protein [Cellulophaga lytica]SNQ43353.1 exported hypothetical protein [Cellulophaga lytica]